VTAGGDILMVADGAAADGLAERLGSARLVRAVDPYEALLKMSRRRWPAIVLTAPREDFTGLCRASRRLQPAAKLFAVCPPAAEPDVRPLARDVIDDYFIYPPTGSDARRIVRAAAGLTEPSAPSAPRAGGLTPRQLADMVAAATTVADLEAHIAALVAARCGWQVQWTDAGRDPEGVRPLLFAAGDVPRTLIPIGAEPEIDGARRLFLEAVQDCLPALVATARRAESLHRLAITDFLTGAYNRRYFYHLTDQILRRGHDKDFRVTMLLFDIDNFKRYNDTYGHAAGDDILREVVRLLKQTSRAQDIVARIGGDEFTVLFWDIAEPRQPDSEPPATAYVMAERFRKAIARHEFPSLGPEARGVLTISGGLATYPDDGKTCRELLSRADKALKSVKDSGKNAIRLIGA